MLNPLFRPSASSIKSSSTLSRMCLLSVLLMIGLGADWLSKAGAQNGQADQEQTMTQEVMTLEVGKPIECKFLGAKNYTFQVFARKKQYIRLLVEEIGVNVTVGVWDSSKKLFEVENTLISGWGRERVIWIAEKETTFRVELRRANPQGRNGKCKVMLAELRFATRRDQAQVEADDWVKDAISLAKRRKQTEALELFKRALVSYEENLGPAHPDYCFALSRIAAQYYGRGQARLTEQETLAWKMLSALEKQPSPDDLEIAQTLVLLSDVSGANGDFSKARELLQQSVSVIERHHGVSHPALISPLAATASLARSLNDYEQAAQIYRRLQGIEKEVSGPEHPNVLYADYEIAYLYLLNRDFLRAENLYLKLLESLKKSVASDHPRIVGVLVDLSKLHRDQNDYVKAEQYLRQALLILSKKFGAESLEAASLLNKLGLLSSDQKKYDEAEELFRRWLKIVEKRLGKHHSSVASGLNNLGLVNSGRKDYERAEKYFKQALAIAERTYGPDKLASVTFLFNLSLVYREQGNYIESEKLLMKILPIREKALGPHHIDIANTYYWLAALYRLKGDYPQATAWATRCLDVVEKNAAGAVGKGSERQRVAYMNRFATWMSEAISLNIEAGADAVEFGLLALLRYKGRALDGMGLTMAGLRAGGTEKTKEMFEQLAVARAKLSSLTTSNEAGLSLQELMKRRREIEVRIGQIEEQIGVLSNGTNRPTAQITVEAVQAALPPDAALVEFVRHRKTYIRREENQDHDNYTAYILRATGKPVMVDLGKADVIDQTVDNLRQTLSNSKRDDFKVPARRVDELVMQPLRKHLGNARHLLLSPDGQLHLVPFAALVDAQGQYLVEHTLFTYLTSGRDLLRLQMRQADVEGTVIFANPAFDENVSDTVSEQQTAENKRDIVKQYKGETPTQLSGQSFSLADVLFKDLPGAAEEAASLKELLPRAEVMLGTQATETALKQVAHPRILHIATHGFFLKDLALPEGEERGLILVRLSSSTAPQQSDADVRVENPLLRSGLALTGANKRKSGSEDGILTALEAAGLDLWGTKLVVLSACDTGVGEVKNGDGVYGLRRALVLAGSESQVMSLWSVSDQGTKELMVEYYKRLLRGEGRSDALRHVQLEMLKQPNRRHPYYWASFIQSGEWANLDG